ncbi:MAG: hypothetical protein CMJ86_06230 [Planctomycetes bacterium]|nr:hypothetical protein [Planctomycetota bacterium]
MAQQPVLETHQLGKAWRTYPSGWARAKEVLSLGSMQTHVPFWALRNVDVTVPPGGALGVVGANGAGKSTLLKLFAGATPPTEGALRVKGRVAAMLELGAGFHPDLSGRENALTTGVLLGCGRREMRRLTEEILEFAGVRAAADTPLRTWSSGMAMRLGFATALAVKPELMILDEVLAVGDLDFQKRCVDAVSAFREDGGSLVLVSHSLYDIRQICDQALWLQAGECMAQGDPARVTGLYSAWYGDRAGQRAVDRDASTDPGPDRPRITRVEVLGTQRDGPLDTLESGQDLAVAIYWENPGAEPLQLGVTFTRQDRTLVAASGTQLDGLLVTGSSGVARLELPCFPLLAGRFTPVAHLLDSKGIHRHHERPTARDLLVTAGTRELGLVRVPHRWTLDTGGPAAALPGTRAQDSAEAQA